MICRGQATRGNILQRYVYHSKSWQQPLRPSFQSAQLPAKIRQSGLLEANAPRGSARQALWQKFDSELLPITIVTASGLTFPIPSDFEFKPPL